MTKKTLKDFLEVYKPKSPDEQKFVDKHVTIKHKDRNGNGDDVFNGNTKTIKRKEERHGYDVGEDEKVYEEVESVEEARIWPGDYEVTSEKSKFGGYRPKIVHKEKGHTMYHGAASYKKPAMAVKHGEAYLSAYAARGDTAAQNATSDFVRANKKHLYVKEEVEIIEGLMHDRYERSHGKKARGTGSWAFTTQRYGSPKQSEMHFTSGQKSLSDAHKEAAAKLGTKHLYVMEDIDIDTVLDEALNMLMSIDEKTLTPAEMKKREEVVKAIKRENPKMDKSMAYAVATKTAKRVAEGVIPTADEPSEHDKKMAQKVRDLLAKEKKPVKEEVEELGEGIATYDKKGKLVGNYKDLETAKKLKPGHHYAPKGTVLAALDRVGKPVWAPTFKEEVEDLDESAKVAAHLIKRYGDNVRKSHVRSAANDFGVGYVALSHAVRKKLGVNRLEEEQIDEISAAKLTDYTAKASDASGHRGMPTAKLDKRYKSMALAHEKIRGRHAKVSANEEVEVEEAVGDITVKTKSPADAFAQHTNQAKKKISVPKDPKTGKTLFQKLTKEDIINRSIDKYVPEEVKFTPEERLLKRLDGLSEAHVNTLLGLFEALNKDNQNKMIETVETREGINQLLNFALDNRGE